MRLGINTKVTLISLGMILLFGLAFGYYIIMYQAHVMKQELEERVNVLMANLSLISEYPLLIRDKDAIIRLTKGVLAQKDIIFCRIENKEGTFFYEEGTREEDRHSDFITNIETKKHVEKVDEELILGIHKEEVEEIGKIHMGVSYSGLNRKLNREKMIMLAIVISAIITTCLTIYFILNRILAWPVKQLVRATEEISKGNLINKVPIETKDEIGVLAASFNKMTEDLLKTTVSKDYLDSVINNMMDCLIVVGHDGIIKTVNQTVLNLLGYTKDELLGQSIEIVFSDRKEYGNEKEEVASFKGTEVVGHLKESPIDSIETTYISKDGRIWLKLRV